MASKGQGSPRVWVSKEVLGRAVLLFGAFVGMKALSEFFVFPPQPGAAVWLPSGLTLAVFMRAETRRWPVYLLAVFLAELLLVPLYGDAWNVAVFWALGNCLRTVVGAGLMRRWLYQSVTFSRPRDVAVLLVAHELGPMHALVTRALKAEGVTHVFGLLGHELLAIYDAWGGPVFYELKEDKGDRSKRGKGKPPPGRGPPAP